MTHDTEYYPIFKYISNQMLKLLPENVLKIVSVKLGVIPPPQKKNRHSHMIYTEQNSLYKRTVSVYLFTPSGRTIFRSLPLKTFDSGTKTLATHTHTDTKK